jgi:hypothetical protein
MNTEPITLSPEHSSRLRALHHLVPFLSMDELIEELAFACDPRNCLECLTESMESGSELRRVESLIFAENARECLGDWDALVESAKSVPAYNPADYPEPEPEPEPVPSNIVPFKIVDPAPDPVPSNIVPFIIVR